MTNPDHRRRQLAGNFAKGLGLDERSRLAGLIDGHNGAAWQCPDHLDLLSYSLGHAAGITERRCGIVDALPGDNTRRGAS